MLMQAMKSWACMSSVISSVSGKARSYTEKVYELDVNNRKFTETVGTIYRYSPIS